MSAFGEFVSSHPVPDHLQPLPILEGSIVACVDDSERNCTFATEVFQISRFCCPGRVVIVNLGVQVTHIYAGNAAEGIQPRLCACNWFDITKESPGKNSAVLIDVLSELPGNLIGREMHCSTGSIGLVKSEKTHEATGSLNLFGHPHMRTGCVKAPRLPGLCRSRQAGALNAKRYMALVEIVQNFLELGWVKAVC